MSRVDVTGSISNNGLFTSYSLESKDQGLDPSCNLREFTETIHSLFPHVTRKKIKQQDNSVATIYQGINIKPLDPLTLKPGCPLDSSKIMGLLPSDCRADTLENGTVCCMLETDFLSNGSVVSKTLNFNCDKTFSVAIANNIIDLKPLGISNTFQETKESISTIFKCVEKIRLCTGVRITQNVVCTRFHVLEKLDERSTGISSRQIRSVSCLRVVKFNAVSQTCVTCQRMTKKLKTSDNKENTKGSETKDDGQLSLISKADIKKLLPNAPDILLEMLVSQFKNAGVHPKGRRWSKEVINSCLQKYTRSQAVYKQIRNCQRLVLPSPLFLLTYKNKVKHNVGFHHEIFR